MINKDITKGRKHNLNSRYVSSRDMDIMLGNMFDEQREEKTLEYTEYDEEDEDVFEEDEDLSVRWD